MPGSQTQKASDHRREASTESETSRQPNPAAHPQGSLWRKWDLHLHAPGTKKNDAYKLPGGNEWDEYCRLLEESDVWVFGITDYFSADGFLRTRSEFRSRYPGSKKLLLPNIELCLDTVANKDNDYINIHVIFNPAVSDMQLKKFLSKLATNRTVGSRVVFASELATESDFNEATTTRAHIETAIEDTFGSDGRLEHLLVVPAVNNDGIRPKSGAARREAISQEIDKFSDALFGNSKNVTHYEQPDRWGANETAPARAVLAGSDAHSFQDLREWLGKTLFRDGSIFKQETWIKADVTYEGLKQIVFEPSGRVVIGDRPDVMKRQEAKPRRFIRSLSIEPVENYDGRFGQWFRGTRIPLNPELVAIIGNKGSGKSALTDILGLLGNSHKQRNLRSDKPEELFSFLSKEKFLKQGCASNFKAVLEWHAGEPDSSALNVNTDGNRAENVEYLPQKYLEKICANIDDNEFRGKLNEVIFGYVKPSDTYGKHTLDELVSYLADQAEADIRQASVVLRECNQAVVQMEKKLTLGYAQETESQILTLQRDLEAHISARPVAVPKPADEDPAAAAIHEQLTETENRTEQLRVEHTKLSSEHAQLTRQVEDLGQAKQAIERQVSELQSLEKRYEALFKESGLKFGDVVSITFNADPIDDVLTRATARLAELEPALVPADTLRHIDLVLEEAEVQAKRTASIEWQLQTLSERHVQLLENLNKPSRDYQLYLQRDQEWEVRRLQLEGVPNDPAERTLNWFRQEMERIESSYPAKLRELRQNRETVSKKIFGLKKKLLTFLNTIKESIDQEIASRSKDLRDYNITIESGLLLSNTFSDDFLRSISQAKKGSFHGSEDGKAELQRLLEPVAAWEDEEAVFAALASIVDAIDFDSRYPAADGQRERRDIFDQLKQGKEPVDFYDFVFGFSYLQPTYGLKVDGKALTELSPGERGGVLLVFYLMLDKRDIPLVIDQPEDNLDNKSVFEVLVTFLKEAKKRRQIIIATHNPNLAVVADAEQIVHVEIDKKQGKNEFSFFSGGIENHKLNKAVVDILEGTLPAFDNRRLKYRRRH